MAIAPVIPDPILAPGEAPAAVQTEAVSRRYGHGEAAVHALRAPRAGQSA